MFTAVYSSEVSDPFECFDSGGWETGRATDL